MTNANSPRPTTEVHAVILDSFDDMVAQLLDRVAGLTDAEYRWEPVDGMWSVRDGQPPTVDTDTNRDLEDAPMTTIAWRLWHLAVDCFADYTARFAGTPFDEVDRSWTMSADEAVDWLWSSWAAFRATLAGYEDWFAELGDGFGPWHRHCVADFAMHASNELVHHGAEIALLRDLYANSSREPLDLSLGEALYSLRAIRRLKPDPIPDEALDTIVDAAIQAPNGGNLQLWHFIVVTDDDKRRQFAPLYHEAWWAKRRDEGYETPADLPERYAPARRLADEFGDAPAVVLLCAVARGPAAANAIIPAVQNLLLAARAHGIGGTITTLHASVERRVHELFDIPDTAQVVYAIPLGYPRGNFGPVSRRPRAEVSSRDRWARGAR
ncbi:MAG: nitroreductase family protein [Actinomycetota bacterium]